MKTLVAPQWDAYELIDSGNGRRLERFGTYTLSRPDPQALWQRALKDDAWNNADATFIEEGKRGNWERRSNVPHAWPMRHDSLTLMAKLTPFKHTGIFAEQRAHWLWIADTLKDATRETRVLNLFGYTGAATLIAAANGAQVTHVDASRPSIGWARENQAASSLEPAPIRWILDDALRFVQREERRGSRYDGIIMDPPVFGHGPNGERWEFNEHFPQLLAACSRILTEQPRFLLINAYAVSASALMLEHMLADLRLSGNLESGELALRETDRGRLLSTGIFARWQNK